MSKHRETLLRASAEDKVRRRAKTQVHYASAQSRRYGTECDLTPERWLDMVLESDGVCYYCKENVGLLNVVLEHQVPLARGGGTTADNVVPACAACNSRKSDKTADEFLNVEGQHVRRRVTKAKKAAKPIVVMLSASTSAILDEILRQNPDMEGNKSAAIRKALYDWQDRNAPDLKAPTEETR